MWWLPIASLWVGALLGFLMGVFLVGCRETAHSRNDDLLIKPKRRLAVDDLLMQLDMEPQRSVAMDDLLILAGSEGQNLHKPGIDLRREVATQLGCDAPIPPPPTPPAPQYIREGYVPPKPGKPKKATGKVQPLYPWPPPPKQSETDNNYDGITFSE